MSNKRKVMSELGSASGCVNRCLDIMNHIKRGYIGSERTEMIERLQKADRAILFVAHEIDRLENGG